MSGAAGAVAALGGPVYSVGGNVTDTFVGSCAVTKQYNSAGTITDTTSTTGAITNTSWCTPNVYAPGGCTIRAHVNSGTAPSGSALDADLALSSSRSWALSQVGTGSKTCSLLITIKDALGNVLKSVAITLTATVP